MAHRDDEERVTAVDTCPSLAAAHSGPCTAHAQTGPPTQRREVLVILPAYNEARSVGGVVDEVRTWLPDVDVLVVDDGSSDGTATTAAAHGASVLRLPYNMGVGGAMRAGYRYAARMGYSAAVQVDADGQHDPQEVPALLEALQHADVVIGARFAGEGDYRVRGPRRWAMRGLAWSVSRRVRTNLTDVTSGFRACNSDAVRLFAAHYPAEYLGDTVEALLIAQTAGLRVRQVPARMRVREQGVSSQNTWRACLYLVRTVMAITVNGMRAGQELRVSPALVTVEASA